MHLYLEETFQPSQRAIEVSRRDTAWDLMRRVKKLPAYHHNDCPDGLVDLSGAVNTLMRDWIDHYTSSLPPVQFSEALSYGPISGSSELLQAAAGFFNSFFCPSIPVEPEDILASNGVTSSIDLVAWTICDPGDAILALTPTFYMVELDLSLRAGVVTIPVSTTSISDPFGPDGIPYVIRALDAATDGAARRRGVRCRGLFICNPSNPQGRCYDRQTLLALAQWCTRRGMHLIVDEIYALSSFEAGRRQGEAGYDMNVTVPSPTISTSFTSILSIDLSATNPPQNIHCLYSLSKDLGMGGLRMGFLITRNQAIRSAAAKASWFNWMTRFSDTFTTHLLRQHDLLQDYVTTYRKRLTEAYMSASYSLEELQIPFQPANAGLFIFIDLGEWISHFERRGDDPTAPSPELRLCDYLVSQGVFLNPGQYAGCDLPGHFRLVFTGDPGATKIGIQRLKLALDKLRSRPPSDGAFSQL